MQNDREHLDETIDRLLQEWSEEVEVTADFQREVWRRVKQSPPKFYPFFEKIASFLFGPMREVVLLALVVLVTWIWGLTHPPQPDYSAHDAYLISISPFDPHHYKAFSP